MSDFLFSIAGRNPNFIIGKWDTNNLSPATKEIYGDFFSKELGQLQINKYEFWFKDTISFIPYTGQPVFIADTLGNVTHTGNLTTKKNVTIEENLTVKKLVTVDDNATFKKDVEVVQNLNVKKDVKVDGKLEVTSDIRTTGNIFAANLSSLLAAASSIGDIQKSIDSIKKQIEELKTSQATGTGTGAGTGTGTGAGTGTGTGAGGNLGGGPNLGTGFRGGSSWWPEELLRALPNVTSVGNAFRLPLYATSWPNIFFMPPLNPKPDARGVYSPYWTDDELRRWAEYYKVPTNSVLIELKDLYRSATTGETGYGDVGYVWVDPREQHVIDMLLDRQPRTFDLTVPGLHSVPGIYLAAPLKAIVPSIPPFTDSNNIGVNQYTDNIQRPRVRSLSYNQQNTPSYYVLNYSKKAGTAVDKYDIYPEAFYFPHVITGNSIRIGTGRFDYPNQNFIDYRDNFTIFAGDPNGIIEVFEPTVDLRNLPPIYTGPYSPVTEFTSPAKYRLPYFLSGGNLSYPVYLHPRYKYRVLIPSWLNDGGINLFGLHEREDGGKTVLTSFIGVNASATFLSYPPVKGTFVANTGPGTDIFIKAFSGDSPRISQRNSGIHLGQLAVFRTANPNGRAGGPTVNLTDRDQSIEILIDPTQNTAPITSLQYGLTFADPNAANYRTIRVIEKRDDNQVESIPFYNRGSTLTESERFAMRDFFEAYPSP